MLAILVASHAVMIRLLVGIWQKARWRLHSDSLTALIASWDEGVLIILLSLGGAQEAHLSSVIIATRIALIR